MRARRTIAVITALLGLTLVTAGTASASPGTWRAYGNDNPIIGSTSEWRCAASTTISTNVVAQVCAIRSGHGSGWDVQGAVIVRNNRSSLYSTAATVAVWDRFNVELIDTWYCGSSGVAAHSWSVCFGQTFLHGSIFAEGTAKGQSLGQTGEI